MDGPWRVSSLLGLLDLGTLIALAVIGAYLIAAFVLLLNRRRGSADDEDDDSILGGAPTIAALQAIPYWASRRARAPVLTATLVLVALLWGAAYMLAPDRKAFLASREWQVQPLYLAAHIVALRLFASIFARNYLDGTAHLVLPGQEAERAVRTVLGPLGLIAAVLVALPFCLSDLRYFLGPGYTKLSGSIMPNAVDWLMYAIWFVEWTLNAFIWITLVSFLVLNVRAIRSHAFREPIETVLLQKQYRPFLRMSAQGATVALLFGCATVAYIAHAGGELTDYLGLGITVSLLAVCFVPPWITLQRKVDHAVKAEMIGLSGALVPEASRGTAAATIADLESRQSQTLALLRLLHIERLHEDVGRREATAIAVRLMAPVLTIGWNVWNNGAAVQKAWETWKRMLS